MKEIWISTENKHKKEEFEILLTPLGYQIHTPDELAYFPSVEETGTTFAENALLKAKTLYNIVHQPVIADDSGLMVLALNGEPGVYSARYAGNDATDVDNKLLLLKNMQGITERTAMFISVIAVVENEQQHECFEGTVQGEILLTEQGENGFGYDSLFFAPELNKTFAEATQSEKNRISHRARALKKMMVSDFFKENQK